MNTQKVWDKEWRCFHCDEVFTDPASSEAHFGKTPATIPACLPKDATMRDLLMHIRKQNDELAKHVGATMDTYNDEEQDHRLSIRNQHVDPPVPVLHPTEAVNLFDEEVKEVQQEHIEKLAMQFLTRSSTNVYLLDDKVILKAIDVATRLVKLNRGI